MSGGESPPAPTDRRFERYVALGDSSTEGLDDPDGRGGYRGWADRLAETIARTQGGLSYANLGVRGRHTREVRDEQLGPALAMEPDLATVFSGTNDLASRGFDLDAVVEDLEIVLTELTTRGVTVLTFTLPGLSRVLPTARFVGGRVAAFNAAVREVATRRGARLVDFEAHPVAGDPRLWSEDRLHANSAGHERIAAALAHALGLPGCDEAWARPLPPPRASTVVGRVGRELRWVRRYLVPWLWRHALGRSSGDGRSCKRPTLGPVTFAPDPSGPGSRALVASSGAAI